MLKFMRGLWRQWRYDAAMGHLFHVWMYLWVRRFNDPDDVGDQQAFTLVDERLVWMVNYRSGE